MTVIIRTKLYSVRLYYFDMSNKTKQEANK